MFRRGPDTVMPWGKGLNNYLPLLIASARSPGYLRQQLEGPFTGAKIGQMQADIGSNNPNQGNPGKIQTLSYHLRTDKDSGLLLLKGVQDFLIGTLPNSGIAVHSHHKGARETALYLFFNLLSSQAKIPDMRALTLGTEFRNYAFESAIMALQMFRQKMVS